MFLAAAFVLAQQPQIGLIVHKKRPAIVESREPTLARRPIGELSVAKVQEMVVKEFPAAKALNYVVLSARRPYIEGKASILASRISSVVTSLNLFVLTDGQPISSNIFSVKALDVPSDEPIVFVINGRSSGKAVLRITSTMGGTDATRLELPAGEFHIPVASMGVDPQVILAVEEALHRIEIGTVQIFRTR
jgi:hypothetical protein